MGQHLRHTAHTHQILIDRCDGEQEHDCSGKDCAVVGDLAHLAPADVAIVKLCRQKRICGHNGTGFGGGYDAEDESGKIMNGTTIGTAACRDASPRRFKLGLASTGQSQMRPRK